MMAANAAEYNTLLDDETAALWRTTWPLLHFAHHVQLHRAITRVTSWCRTLIRAVLVVVRFHAIFAAENRRICLRYSEDNNYANLASNSRRHGWTNMTPAAIFFVGHSLKGLSGCWAVLKRKSVIFVSSCQSSTILGRLTESRSTFNTLWLTQNGMYYCITRTVVGSCVPPVSSQVRATKKVRIRTKASPWSFLYFCLSYYHNLALIFSVDLLWRDHIIV